MITVDLIKLHNFEIKFTYIDETSFNLNMFSYIVFLFNLKFISKVFIYLTNKYII